MSCKIHQSITLFYNIKSIWNLESNDGVIEYAVKIKNRD